MASPEDMSVCAQIWREEGRRARREERLRWFYPVTPVRISLASCTRGDRAHVKSCGGCCRVFQCLGSFKSGSKF